LTFPLRIVLLFALVGFGLTFVIEAGYAARSTLVQGVRRDRPDGPYRTEGAAVRVVDLPEDVVVQRGKDDAATLVDRKALERRGGLVTMDLVAGLALAARIGCGLAALTAWLASKLLSDRSQFAQ
jgi:hypothetical protein